MKNWPRRSPSTAVTSPSLRSMPLLMQVCVCKWVQWSVRISCLVCWNNNNNKQCFLRFRFVLNEWNWTDVAETIIETKAFYFQILWETIIPWFPCAVMVMFFTIIQHKHLWGRCVCVRVRVRARVLWLGVCCSFAVWAHRVHTVEKPL